jgi:hypothetical protein
MQHSMLDVLVGSMKLNYQCDRQLKQWYLDTHMTKVLPEAGHFQLRQH